MVEEEGGEGEWSPMEWESTDWTLAGVVESIVSVFVSVIVSVIVPVFVSVIVPFFVSVFATVTLSLGDCPSAGPPWSPPSFTEFSGDDMARSCLATRYGRSDSHGKRLRKTG